MTFYPARVQAYFLQPRNVGEIEHADAVGDSGSLICGAVLRLSLSVDASSHRITEAKFKATGCGYLIAAASVLTEIVNGLSLGEAGRMCESELAESVIAEYLSGVPPEKAECVRLCRAALSAALAAYRRTTLEEWTGDEALICTCFGVSERQIEHAIRAGSLATIKQVTSACNAGGGCRSCHPLIEDILESINREASILNHQ